MNCRACNRPLEILDREGQVVALEWHNARRVETVNYAVPTPYSILYAVSRRWVCNRASVLDHHARALDTRKEETKL